MEYYLTKICIQKGMALLYFIAFLIVVNQYRALLGSSGILPVTRFVKGFSFLQKPSIFLFHSSDRFLQIMGWFGLGLSLIALLGISEQYGFFVSMLVWFLLWAIYQSFVNVGQIFYGYGWEILLLEAGFLAVFLGAANVPPSALVIWLYRWLLFRVMFGAGLIKLRCDSCWKDLSCMLFFYETQPLPGPLSRLFHRLPVFIHKVSVVFTFFIELIVPFFFFWPEEMVVWAGLCTILFQVVLICVGNFSWLNWITIVLCFSCFNDTILLKIFPFALPQKIWAIGFYQEALSILLIALVAYLSIKPIKNLFLRRQVMNRNFDPFNLVNTYGVFGTVSRKRYEIIIEGTEDSVVIATTKWLPYEFKGKPGFIRRHPLQVSPYHYKIDWQMWFASMSSAEQNPWFFSFVEKLLRGDAAVLGLLKENPFPNKPPQIIRAELYEYHFASPKDSNGAFWERRWIREYLPASKLLMPAQNTK